jgi:UDP-N-acetylglucosamine 2-epimerase (non-hydrolysing)
MTTKKILCFFGTRPEAIKMAPVVAALRARKAFRVTVAVSAQHRALLDQVLELFGIRSQIDLDLMRPRQSLTELTTRVLTAFDPALNRVKPDLVLVHGDTTTSLGGALASYYKKIPVGHVEAGLRTGDPYRPFPEEMNRRLTDAISTLYFAPTAASQRNLFKEGVNPERVFVTGNTVIDALKTTVKKNRPLKAAGLKKILTAPRIILMTAHRRENFGDPFEHVLGAVARLAARFPDAHWVYPVHPNPNVLGPARRRLGKISNVHLTAPLDYADLVTVMDKSTLVLTDSGGLQEEAPALGKPVLVLRDVTERPEAVEAGTVKLVGTDGAAIEKNVARLLTDRRAYEQMANAVNPYGDGRAAERIAQAIEWHFKMTSRRPFPFHGH